MDGRLRPLEPRFFYVITKFATGGVETVNGKVWSAPPIWRRWIGTDFDEFVIKVNGMFEEIK